MSTTDKSLLQTILTLLDVLSSHKSEGKSWIHLLSLLCIFAILHQENTASPCPQSSSANPLQSLLGDVLKGTSTTKSSDSPAANTLLSLLPLLNSPQIKSKLNPANIAAVMNVMQNLTATPNNEKPPKSTSPSTSPSTQPSPTAAATPPPNESASPKSAPSSPERYLDWKNSF